MLPIANTAHQTNEEIRDKEVRLISESGEQLGIMSAQDALRMAEERELDLLIKFAESCAEVAVMDKAPKLEGRHMSIFLSPKPNKEKK